jgi:putative Ca2+/H+ antiporter (TMEM165/GDT1 family)
MLKIRIHVLLTAGAAVFALRHVSKQISSMQNGLFHKKIRRRLTGLPPAASEIDSAAHSAELASKSTAPFGFNAFDSNHDGSIDKAEYVAGLKKLEYFMESDFSPSSSNGWFTSFPSKFAGLNSSTGTKDKDEMKFWPAFHSSVAMILATEVGDKTFFIAAVLSMRNARSAVLLGALLALYCMTVLSTMMGLILPSLLPRQYTTLFGGLLFLYFGVKLICDSRGMSHKVSEELEEVEEELGATTSKKKDRDDENDVERNGGGTQMSSAFSASRALSWEKAFLQSLSLTFLAEWGDRSQIATIALAAHKEPFGVTLGGCVGHTMCTGVAVLGGRMLASRISEKTVAMVGGLIFLAFGVHSLLCDE